MAKSVFGNYEVKVVNVEDMGKGKALTMADALKATGHGTVDQWIEVLKAEGYGIKAGYNGRHIIVLYKDVPFLSLHLNNGTSAIIWLRKSGTALWVADNGDFKVGQYAERLFSEKKEVGYRIAYSQLAEALFR